MVNASEAFCLVVYDVADDGIRYQFSETCLDYGLERFQMSAFWGHLSASRRKELFVKLSEMLGTKAGRILVQPIGAEDLKRRYVLHQKASRESENEGGEPITKHREFRESSQPISSAPSARSGEPITKHREFREPGVEKPTIIKF